MIDLFSEEVRNNPYPAYKQIRDAGPAVFDRKKRVWFIGRYQDVLNVLRDSEAFSNKGVGFESTLGGQDGLLHARVRKMIQTAFSPSHINSLRSAINTEAERTVKCFSDRNEVEFISEIAGAVPAAVLSWMLGGVDEKIPEFKRWSDAILSSRSRREKKKGSVKRFINRILRSGSATEEEKSQMADMAECEAFLREHFMAVANGTSGGWITDLLCEKHGANQISTEEMIDLGLVFVAAATETTISFIGAAVNILAKDGTLQDQLRSNPDLIEPFLEEVLRYDSPTQRRPRRAVKKVQIGHVMLPKGARVVLLVGSANRDPEKFLRPDEFRMDRNPNPHLSFGAGPHFCPGAQLGKMEARALVTSMLTLLPPFRLARPEEKVEQIPKFVVRGPRKLDITFRRPSEFRDENSES
jgi:cytochrome P450